MAGANRLTRAALRGFALAIRAARALGLPARWTSPTPTNRRIARSGLFDPSAYLRAYPHAGLGVLSPLDHFVAHGARTGHDPNPYFSTTWYLANNPDVALAGVNPLLHYIGFGEREGRAPSRDFDPRYYAARHPDVAVKGDGLLAHFLACGRAEGWLARAPDPAGGSAPRAAEADIVVVKPAAVCAEDAVVLFVFHALEGRLRDHALAYLDALHSADRKIVAVVATDAPFEAAPEVLAKLSGLYVRENVGLDFAAWAHALQLEPRLYSAGSLLLANDSVLPPADGGRIAKLLDAMAANPADVVGLTDSYEAEWHLQSYALLLKPTALRAVALQRFMVAIRDLGGGAEASDPYELTFATAMRASGLTVGALFPSAHPPKSTPERWRDLLGRGFPLIRLSVLQSRDATADWRDVLTARGFDPAVTADALVVPCHNSGAPMSLLTDAMARTMHALTFAEPLKVDYLGPWAFDNSLGAASRGMVSALWRTPYRLNLWPLRKAFHTDMPIAPRVDVINAPEPADVAIVHLNPDGFASMTEVQRRRVDRAGLRIGRWGGDLDQLTADWPDRLDTVEAVWAPSRYCAAGFKAAMGARPVHVVPHVVETPPPPTAAEMAAARTAYGLAPDARVILYAFGGAGDLARKNPFALVRGFEKSGLAGRGWTLVLKTRHLFDRNDAGSELSAMVASARGARLIDAQATGPQMRALMSAADIYASPHCEAGFGLTVAEAMAMGKAVVATDYSGPRDFLDESCGYPVPYRIEPLSQDHGPYRRGGAWAQIDADALAETLDRAALDIEAGRGPGDRARRRISERFSPDAVARTIQTSLAELKVPGS